GLPITGKRLRMETRSGAEPSLEQKSRPSGAEIREPVLGRDRARSMMKRTGRGLAGGRGLRQIKGAGGRLGLSSCPNGGDDPPLGVSAAEKIPHRSDRAVRLRRSKNPAADKPFVWLAGAEG